MGLGIQSIFPPGREQFINYDWIDIASATGYIVFDAFEEIYSGGSSGVLLDSAHASALTGLVYLEGESVLMSTFSGVAGQDFDLDFNSSIFQLPRTIEGDAFVRLSIRTGGAIGNQYFIAKLRKWDATAGETEIASRQSSTVALAATKTRNATLKITVPKTHFKKGNILRLTIECYSADVGEFYFAHNPSDTALGSSFAAGNSRLTLAVPFKLDFM